MIESSKIRDAAVESNDRRNRLRFPAVPVVASFTLGVFLDRWIDIGWQWWLGLSGAAAFVWVLLLARKAARGTVVTVMLGCIAMGGARHHVRWSIADHRSISTYATSLPALVHLNATIDSQPRVIPPNMSSSWSDTERTVFRIRCHWLMHDKQRIRVSGFARFDMDGTLPYEIGDQIEITGVFFRPRLPRNAGDFDFARYMRCDGIRCQVRTRYREAVRKVGQSSGYWFARTRGRIRRRCEDVIKSQLTERTRPIGMALILGNRSEVTSDTRDSFTTSGTMHFLAISGLHVGILALFLWIVCRLLNAGPVLTASVMIAGVAWFAIITDARPPVARASILILVTSLGMPAFRKPTATNLLAIAALCVLILNPTDLFNVGAQLSFLAVAAIIWCSLRLANFRSQRRQAVEPHAHDVGWFARQVRSFRRFLVEAYLVTGAIWLFTAPLVAAEFNLIAPVGLLINVLLIPVVGLALWSGYGVLLVGSILPGFCRPFGWTFDSLLRLLLEIVDLTSAFRLGHVHLASPPTWWLIGFYVLLFLVVCRRRIWLSRDWAWRGLWGWVAAGLFLALLPNGRPGLRCTFISVGHGCSILVETPNGRTLLYDVGMINDGRRAAQVAKTTLWHRNHTGIDVLTISHADVDHFNGVPHLLESVAIGRLLVPRQFLDFDQPPVLTTCEHAYQQGVPIQLLWTDDRIELDEDVSIRVLHPNVDFESSRDNAGSLVLLIEYHSCRLLLTGDLEDEGLQRLLSQPSIDVDILLAPHHGSLAANPVALANWARPEWVIVSGGRAELLPELGRRYGNQCQVISTMLQGAVEFEITDSGQLQCTPFLGGQE